MVSVSHIPPPSHAGGLSEWVTMSCDECKDYEVILARQDDILTRVANALRGDPPPLTSWGHHDLPERAARAVANRTTSE